MPTVRAMPESLPSLLLRLTYLMSATSACRRIKICKTRMWANAQPDGRPAEHRWRPLFNTTKFS